MNESDQTLLKNTLRVMQVIAGAMLLGVLTFLAFCLYRVDFQNGAPPPGLPREALFGLPPVSLIAVGLLVANVPLSLVLPSIQIRAALQQMVAGGRPLPSGAKSDQPASVTARLLVAWQTALIVGLAILEGTAMVACIAYMLERQAIALGVAAVVIVFMLSKFPTESRLTSWLDRQEEVLAGLREEKELRGDR